MTDDPSEMTSDELEAALAGRREAASQEDTWVAWLGEARVYPGRFPSVTTAAAYVLYRSWAEELGQKPLAPFAFARLMLTRFRKAARRGPTGQKCLTYSLSLASAERLRAASVLRPPSPEDQALFSFAELRRAFNPALRQGPHGPTPQEDP